MRITVKIFGPRYFGIGQYDVVTLQLELKEGATVEDVLNRLEELYPGIKSRVVRGRDIVPMHDVWVNGRSIHFLNGLDTSLGDGDVVQIIPPFGG